MLSPRRRWRKFWRDPLIIFGVVLMVMCCTLLFKGLIGPCYIGEVESSLKDFGDSYDTPNAPAIRHLLASKSEKVCNETEGGKCKKPRQFPVDFFTEHQLEHGAFCLHVIGMAYMFVALAIVCDEFFVPSLSVITDKLGISEDVAGATFMAAGGSAPELFTSIIGVFISFDDVGIGTIVGSAVFNILFVIGMCALFSRTDLYLTWWPLFRDVTFYSLALIILIVFFRDNKIRLYEAIVLLLVYVLYVTFMKYNSKIERAVKKLLYKNKVTRVRSTDQLVPNFASRRASTPILHSGSKFRHGLLQLMIHTIDPLHDDIAGKVDEKACQLHAIASLKVLLDATKTSNGSIPAAAQNANSENEVQDNSNVPLPASYTKPPENSIKCSSPPGTAIESDSLGSSSGRFSQETRTTTLEPIPEKDSAATIPNSTSNLQPIMDEVEIEKDSTKEDPPPPEKADGKVQQRVTINITEDSINTITPCNTSTGTESQPSVSKVEEVDEPLDISWPDSHRKRVSYVLVAPIILLLWLTLPDTRRPEKKKWFPVTFIGSILWIAAFSYLMVWWATVVGDSIGIPSEVMGLTFLAAGTSIPDLITSVIVARKGFGDMAVSSSVGSNLFDVTVGLPFPWILYNLIYLEEGGVPVKSKGMVCSIVILFAMLMFVIISIAAFKWKMNKGLGITMFVLYMGFVSVSLLFEFKVIVCKFSG